MPLPMFALYLSKGRVDSGQLRCSMSWHQNVFSWKIWSAIIGPFFLFLWRNYISWGFKFVNCAIHSFNLFTLIFHYLTELRFLSFSLPDWIGYLETGLSVAWKFLHVHPKNWDLYVHPNFSRYSKYFQKPTPTSDMYIQMWLCCDNCDIYKVLAISAESNSNARIKKSIRYIDLICVDSFLFFFFHSYQSIHQSHKSQFFPK